MTSYNHLQSLITMKEAKKEMVMSVQAILICKWLFVTANGSRGHLLRRPWAVEVSVPTVPERNEHVLHLGAQNMLAL